MTDSSSHSSSMLRHRHGAPGQGAMTRYSRSTAWADGSSRATGPGLLRIT
jgi:hypothetical protein